MKQTNLIKVLVVVSVILIIPIASMASETITGKIVGFNSLTHGKEKPVDKADPHIDLEPDFVILRSNGDHFLIPNLPRDVKRKYVYDSVRITGDIHTVYRSIVADQFQVKEGEKYITVWTKSQWEKEQKEKYKK